VNLSEGHSINLPVLLETRLLVQAGSGGGKSWGLRRILEQTATNVQQLVIDPEGEFATLREKFDYVIAAAHDADAVASPQTAAMLARRLMESGVSAILDIYDLKHHERVLFVRRFLDALVNLPRKLWHPVLVVLDEAHVFCPQVGSAESASAVIDIATRGRKRGLCAVLATQRLSKLHKDAAAEMQNKLIGLTGLDVDVKRAADELGMSARDAMQSLRALEPGQFFAFGPALTRVPELVKIGPVTTTHPKAGQRLLQAPPPASEKVRAELAKLADLQKDADQEARTIEELQALNAKLRREATIANKRAGEAGVPEKEVQARIAAAVLEAKRPVTFRFQDGAHQKALQRISEIAQKALGGNAAPAGVVQEPSQRDASAAPAPRVREKKDRAGMPVNLTHHAPAGDVTAPQQKILDVLAQLEAYGIEQADKAMVAAHAGVSPTSGGYFNNLGRLRSGSLIDYPAPGKVALTLLGRARATPPNEAPTLAELHESWMRILPAPQAAILRVLIEAYPNAITKDDLADRVGVSRTSGGYFNNLGRLRTLGAIEYPARGQVIAAAILFPKGQ